MGGEGRGGARLPVTDGCSGSRRVLGEGNRHSIHHTLGNREGRREGSPVSHEGTVARAFHPSRPGDRHGNSSRCHSRVVSHARSPTGRSGWKGRAHSPPHSRHCRRTFTNQSTTRRQVVTRLLMVNRRWVEPCTSPSGKNQVETASSCGFSLLGFSLWAHHLIFFQVIFVCNIADKV